MNLFWAGNPWHTRMFSPKKGATPMLKGCCTVMSFSSLPQSRRRPRLSTTWSGSSL